MVVEIGSAEGRRRAGECFEEGLQLGNAAPLDVGDCGLQPGVDGHRVLSGIAKKPVKKSLLM
jgi:hypothetical protein